MRIWVDTDVGTNPDDGVALLVVLAHPELELVGVSTVSGDTAVRSAVASAYLAGRGVPVVAGAKQPRSGGPAPRWMGHEAAGPIGHVGAGRSAAWPADRLVETVRAARPDVLVAIGPLTNVAELVEADAAPRRIVAMSGVTTPVWHRGVLVEVDHNTASDPAAAAVVGQRTKDLLTVPLDVTVAMRLSDREASTVAARHPRLAHEIAAWQRTAGPVVLHDPLAVLAAVPGEHGDIALEIERGRVGRVDARRAIERILELLAQEPR